MKHAARLVRFGWLSLALAVSACGNDPAITPTASPPTSAADDAGSTPPASVVSAAPITELPGNRTSVYADLGECRVT